MCSRLLTLFLSRLVIEGALVVVFADGRAMRCGDAGSAPVTVRLHSPTLPRKLLINPDLSLGEAYMDGALSIDSDDLYALIELLVVNLSRRPGPLHYRGLAHLRRLYRRLAQFNPAERARRNVAHHYDLSDELYELFLDTDRQYSCAYFSGPEDTLAIAQENKKALIATKLLLEPDLRVLDIGSGWGGLGLHLALVHQARVTGVTLSEAQHRKAEQRASSAGLAHRARFHLQDYRHVEGVFDRIVSVGMFEHVGVPHYREFFATVSERLTDSGVALLHTIGRADGPGTTNPWVAKYIFPGGYSPALSEVLPLIERSGLHVTDIDVWRLHYAETLSAWRDRFEANLSQVRRLYDERFCRMWRFYFIVSELAFRQGGHVVFQIQLAKRRDVVPLTRDYLSASTDDSVPAARATSSA